MFSFGFYNSKNGDRKYNAEQFTKIFDGVIQDGVFGTIGNMFEVTPNSPASNSVIVGKGKAWLAHTWNLLDTPTTMSIDLADPNTKRTDAICIQVNKGYTVTGYTYRTNSLVIVKGTPTSIAGSSMTADIPPTTLLQNPSTYYDANNNKELVIWQYPIAYVTMYGSDKNYGTAETTFAKDVINANNIKSRINVSGGTDAEKYKTWVPLVTGATMNTSLETYIPNYPQMLSDMMLREEGRFNSWFDHIAGSYSGNYETFSGEAFQPNVVYYERSGESPNYIYTPTSDTEPQAGKTYYQFSNAASIELLDTKIDNKILYGYTEPPETLEYGQVYFMLEE